MSDAARPDWADERTERLLTILFVIVGVGFLAIALYSAAGQFDAVVHAWENPGDRDPTRAVMHQLNHEILAGFIGAVLFASGVLRWRERGSK